MLARAALLSALVVLAAAATVGAGAPEIGDQPIPPASTAPQLPDTAVDFDADRRIVEIHLRRDGSARWRFEEWKAFDDEGDREAFEAAAAEIDGNLSYAGEFAEDMRGPVESAEGETGREMALRNVTVETETSRIPEEHGKVVYEFVWTGFAAVEGDRLQAGDALAGYYFGPDSTLLVTWGDDLTFADARPAPDERREEALVWTDRTQFSATGPALVFERRGGGLASSLPGPVGDPVVAAGGALVGVALLVAVVRRRRRRTPPVESGAPAASDDTTAAEGAPDAAAAGDAQAGAATEGADAGDEEPPVELLSDEERVIRQLEDHGGRMKQQKLVEEMDWSETKTSEVVQRLKDDEQVEVYRIGRENVLALPGEMDV